MLLKTSVLVTLASLLSASNAMIAITTKGKRFIQPNTDASVDGEAYFVKGIDYLPGGSSGYTTASGVDVLSDPDQCYRDVYVFQQLGVNTVRIYSLNPALDHDECMTIFNNAGIYLLLDVNTSEYGQYLNRADPGSTYNAEYLGHVFKFIDAFKDYPNVLGFISGNEIINDDSDYASITPKYIRAVQRDMKQYIAAHANRTIPVGYAAADGVELRRATLEYLQCHIEDEDDDISRSDFFGLNTYQWCSGTSDWESSGYDVLNSTMSNTTIPLVFSEFGCNTNSPRTFDEISDGLFGGLVNTFSGGLVYEYSEETSNYGVVEIDDDDGSITYLDDYTNLREQYKNATVPVILESDVEDVDVPDCDADYITSIYSDFGADFDLPEQPDDIADLIKYGVNSSNVGELMNGVDEEKSNYTIYDVETSDIDTATVTFNSEDEINTQSGTTASSKVAPSSETESSSSSSATASASSSSSKGAAGILTPVAGAGLGAIMAALALI